MAFLYRLRRRPRRSRTTRQRWLRRLTGLILLFLLLDALYLAWLWPDWATLQYPRLAPSRFMQQYVAARQYKPARPPLHWQPVPLQRIPLSVRRAVIIAEDARFYQHSGIDWEAVADAALINWQAGRVRYGASTLSQQTVKNLFLDAGRNPLRKWHELILTLGLEANLDKSRILEIYLNIAEFGQGIYGVEAAARHYWGTGVADLDEWQAAQLAATLPSPRKRNPASATPRFLQRARLIYRRM
ncbi:MAG: monofunctional biosynthetic peptidoglycan transglycosylase [Proteobacteria bacterium]|jgi:monofunctional glycosyltransferase|nr:monofunctional biosynthetic peptidoglycan transglycosylase [Pseudomonadota bacterium]